MAFPKSRNLAQAQLKPRNTVIYHQIPNTHINSIINKQSKLTIKHARTHTHTHTNHQICQNQSFRLRKLPDDQIEFNETMKQQISISIKNRIT